MKTKLLFSIAVGTTLALAAFCVWQARQLQATRRQLTATEQLLRAANDARQQSDDSAALFQRQHARMSEQAFQLSGLVATLRTSEAQNASNYAALRSQFVSTNRSESAGSSGNPFTGTAMGEMFNKMMKDPAMRDLMRTQQKWMVTSMYQPLFNELKLSPDQQARFSELLLDDQMKTLEKTQASFQEGGLDLSKLAEGARDEEKQLETGIRDLLGDENFSHYQDYKKTIGERVQLNQFKQQLEGSSSPLREDQFKSLMGLMKEERERTPPPFPADGKESLANVSQMLSGDLMEKQFQWQEEVNQRVRERAGQLLTADQWKAFGDFQTQQLDMQKFGMKMAREMLGPQQQKQELQLVPPVK